MWAVEGANPYMKIGGLIKQIKGAVKKSATKPVDFLDMEAHGL